MSKFRKKPVVIEAQQWVDRKRVPPAPDRLLREKSGRWELKTLEGWFKLTPMDWIICGVAGEFYPCKPDIFEQTYEAANDKQQGEP